MQYSRYELSKEPDFSVSGRDALEGLTSRILADIKDSPGKEAFVHPRIIAGERRLSNDTIIPIRCLMLDPKPMPYCEMPNNVIAQYKTILVDDDSKGTSTASGLTGPAPKAVSQIESEICAPARDRIRKGLKDVVYSAFPPISATDFQGELYMGPKEDRFLLVVYKEGSLVSIKDASLLMKLHEWVERVKLPDCRSGLKILVKRLGIEFKRSERLSIIHTVTDVTEPSGFRLTPKYLRQVEWDEEQTRKKEEGDKLVDVVEKVQRFLEFDHVQNLNFLFEY